jgi:hypothetical protein
MEGCMDCLTYNYNIVKAKLPKNRWRPTNHQQSTKDCPTRRNFWKKYLAALNQEQGRDIDTTNIPDTRQENG